MQRLSLALVALVFVTAIAPVAADDWESFPIGELTDEEIAQFQGAIGAFLLEREARTIDEITIGELRELGARLSVISQEVDYVRSARNASRFIPGAGHFRINEPGAGAAFLSGSIVLSAGTLIGAYFLLPDDVQFGEVDYINDSFREIGTAWRGESIASFFPAFAALVGGALGQAILGEIASQDAERRARAQIESGRVQFTPQPFIGPDATGRLMLGMRFGL